MLASKPRLDHGLQVRATLLVVLLFGFLLGSAQGLRAQYGSPVALVGQGGTPPSNQGFDVTLSADGNTAIWHNSLPCDTSSLG